MAHPLSNRTRDRVTTRARRACPILILATLAACGTYDAPTASQDFVLGRSYHLELYTHCGILSAKLGGVIFFADPPLSDGSGNPPRGWGNPFDEGTAQLVSPTDMEFHDDKGNDAHFTTTPSGGVPSLPRCL